MILDTLNEFCDAIALNTGGAGTYLVGSQIDTLAADNIGADQDLYLVIQIETTVTSAANGASVQFHLASDASAAVATDGSATYHFSTAAIAEATLVAGYQVCAVKLPGGTYERYLGILQTTSGEAVTAGKINAFLTRDVAAFKAYADGV